MSGNMAPCTGDMCLHVVLGCMYRGHVSACSACCMYRGHVSACSACCIRCVGHILIGLEYRLVVTVSVYIIHVCVSVSACGVSVCECV